MLQKASDVKLSEQDKPFWEKIMDQRGKIAEKAYKLGKKEYAELIVRESDGGKCPRCNKEWKRIEFKDSNNTRIYYRPDCDCFYRCPNCLTELFDEMMRGILAKTNYYCPDCGWPLVKDGKKYWGKSWDEWFKEHRKSSPWKIWELKKELGIVREVK